MNRLSPNWLEMALLTTMEKAVYNSVTLVCCFTLLVLMFLMFCVLMLYFANVKIIMCCWLIPS